jgi:hypothetical protein
VEIKYLCIILAHYEFCRLIDFWKQRTFSYP